VEEGKSITPARRDRAAKITGAYIPVPAMLAGVTGKLWEMHDPIPMIAEWELKFSIR
jgi:hypothetical protein